MIGVNFSPCRTWRYTLERQVSLCEGTLLVMGVNPSTADEKKNDPTIRKDIGFAERWGFGQLLKGNLFGFRSTDIRGLTGAEDAVGPENDYWLQKMVNQADLIVVAWGATGKLPPRLRNRWRDFVLLAAPRNLYCLGVNADGSPLHPLYAPYDSERRLWTPPK